MENVIQSKFYCNCIVSRKKCLYISLGTAKTQAERSKLFQTRNPLRFKEHKSKYQQKLKNDPVKHAADKLKVNLRNQKYRQRKKENLQAQRQDPIEVQSPPFGTYQSRARSLNRVKRMLPKDPSQQVNGDCIRFQRSFKEFSHSNN